MRLTGTEASRSACVLAVAMAGLAWLAFSAVAFADVEPANETLAGAEGPLTTDVDYAGSLAHPQDESDWYFFHAQPQVELKIVASPTGCGSTDFNMRLYGRNGAGFESDGVLGWSSTITYTTPPGAPRLYYLRLICRPSAGGAYKFRITSNVEGALIPGEREFGAPVELGEPNETREQAIGPLAGGVTYQGATTTENDQDWFFFYAKPAQEVELAVTSADLNCGFHPHADFRLHYGEHSSRRVSIFVNGVHRIVHKTAPDLRRYEISASCPLSSYLFRITPAGALASQACVDALTARGRLAAQLTRLQRSRQNAKRSHARKVRRMTKQERRTRKPALKRRLARELKRTKRKNRHRLGRLARGVRQSREPLRAQRAAAASLCV